ncbi:BREX system P-loop protein BrxC [Candidatus Nomurabacteria bacterium]|nr:BREX system P-loop protein BrxC [Candidatus Nomurabacteria bacterium]
MKIKDLFLKDIDRSINGVIKVDQQDDANVIQELEEYVVTKEMAKHFADFFEMYEKSLQAPTDKIGIWISGFFGSGKSHFLKILSYLFSDRVLNDKKAIDFFKGKFDDSFKYNEISRLLNQKKTEAILFNIDSKSNVGSKKSKDGIVEVLMKAFNDHLGYCSDLPYLAEIERLMDEDGTYNEFKEYYQSQNNESWEQGRETMAFSNDAFIEALTKVKNISQDSVKEYLRTAKDDYSLSSDKLAKIIKNYIERTNTRVLFMIDEVGQYIGDNTQLMLNLQTVTEDLGRECMGEAWIIVTAQEAIDKIAKETIQGSDFSKIRGRFSTNLSLSSQNTDEVIRKRILEKKTEVTGELESMYEENSASLKNLMSFSQGTSTMKLFNDKEDFAKNYPFVPYQFDLLQKVFEMIRTVGATGAHLSEGERSMLSGFQEAVKTIASEDIGKIVSFDRFYSSLEEFLMSNIKRTINKASELSTIDNEDMKVLKILFMIKHIKEVRPNLENITTLSITEINQNKIQLRERIVKSLEKLEKENLIHKSGEEYDFLTDEEQDVNRQIKQVQIDSDEIVKYYSEIIFKDYVEDKVTVDRHNVFSFNKIIDDHHFSNQRDNFDITLKIITPESSEYSDDYNSIVFRYSGDVSIGIIILKDNDTLRELDFK